MCVIGFGSSCLSRVALLIFYWLWFVVVLSFCANTKTHSTNLNWDFLVVSFYFIGKKGEALVTNRATYPVDDVVEPEDEDYIDATEGWWGVNISSVAYVDCVIFMIQMKSLVFFLFFGNQVLGFRVKALFPLPPPLPPFPPPLTTSISSACYLNCALQYDNCHSGLTMLPENVK